MAILLLFEKTDSLSYSELQETTNILEDQFPRYLQSLLESKLLVCNSDVSTKKVESPKSQKYPGLSLVARP